MLSIFRFAIGGIPVSNVRNNFKDAKQLKKMLGKGPRKKNTQFARVLLTKSDVKTPYDNEGMSRRIVALNKVYMEEITMMMNAGQYKNQLADLGVVITKVKMAKGLNFLNIHWMSKNKNLDDNLLNEILIKALAELQEQMGSVRFTSRVPLLRFVRDKRLESELKLEEIFDSIDFGADFKPVHESKVFTPDFVDKEQKFPEMRQNVLGLDHAKIKENIENKILKFKAIRIEFLDEDAEKKDHPIPEKLIVFNQKEFFKFYKRRRILELKMKKKLGGKYSAGDADKYEYIFPDVEEEDDKNDYEYLSQYENEDESEDEKDIRC